MIYFVFTEFTSKGVETENYLIYENLLLALYLEG